MLRVAILQVLTAGAAVDIFPPAPAGSKGAGTRYTVTLAGQPAPTYQSVAPSDAPGPQRGKSVSWVSFDAAGSVAVTVAPRGGLVWQSCTVRPLSLGIAPTRTANGNASFSVSPGTKVSVEFNTAEHPDLGSNHPLLLFSNLPDPAAPPPPSAFVFGPGLHDVGVGYRIPAGTVVHLAAGAWVRGTFTTDGVRANGITIQGRGVLYGI